MSSFLIYVGIVLVLILLSLVVVFNFLRYRFKGDKTVLFITLFVLLFVADIIFTLSILVTES